MKEQAIRLIRNSYDSNMVICLTYPNGHHLIDEHKAIRLVELCREDIVITGLKIILGSTNYTIESISPDDYYSKELGDK